MNTARDVHPLLENCRENITLAEDPIWVLIKLGDVPRIDLHLTLLWNLKYKSPNEFQDGQTVN